KSKLASSLEMFTESSFQLHKRPAGELYVLGQAKLLNGYAELKKDLPRITALQLLADILIQAIHDTEPHPEVYSLLKDTLAAFKEKSILPELFLTAFGIKFLELSGYPMEFAYCAECDSSLERKKVFLIPHRGGALCENCCPSGPARLKVSPAGLEVMKKLKSLPMKKIHILKLRPSFLRELFLAVLEYLERTIERPLKTLEYYLKVVPLQP
ncbi:MAG TPA: DNA repair protein RecO, partial [bacterium]|nr:DNA repair protein RecO [bacterium]